MEEPKDIFTSFYQRAHQAEERLARLEAALASKQDHGIKELIEKVDKLQLKLEEARLLQVNEREKALKEVEQLTLENAKLQYRVTHLVRALQEADHELESNSEVAICDTTKSAE